MRVYLLTLLFVGISGRQECSSSENASMQKEFTECATKLDHAYFQDKENLDKITDLEAATCELFSETIEDCGKAWKRCHDGEDIRIMKDMYINHLVVQYGQNQDGVDVNRCQVVKEYRESGRHYGDYGDEDLCSAAKTDEMTRKFQECSHSTSSAAYQVVVDITDPTSIVDTLCKALTTIGTVCAKTLKECYNKEDLNRMKNDHLKEMKSFLLQFVEGKVKRDSLSNCPVLKNIDKPIEEEVFEDYDRTNDINGNQPVHSSTNYEHPKETIEFNIEDYEMMKEDTIQTVEHVVEVESAPEIINTSPKEELPLATTTPTVAPSKMDSLKAMPAKSTEESKAMPDNSTEESKAMPAKSTEESKSTEETAVTGKMTSNIENSSSICLLQRGVGIICLIVSLLSFYV